MDGSVPNQGGQKFFQNPGSMHATHYPNSPNIVQNPNSPPVLKPQALEGLLQQRHTMNMPGAPTMPQNPYALAAWMKNTPMAPGTARSSEHLRNGSPREQFVVETSRYCQTGYQAAQPMDPMGR